jgi:hypothetical protein
MYTCAQCGITADEPEGWTRLVIQDADYVAGAPMVPFVATGASVELFFHAVACREGWGTAHDLPPTGPA